MDKVIAEIIVGAIILTMLIMVIPIYRSSASLVCEAGEKIDINENIREVTSKRLPRVNDFISGNYLIDLVHGFDKNNFKLTLKMDNQVYYVKKWDSLEKVGIKEDMMFKVVRADYLKDMIEMEFLLNSPDFIA